MKHRTDDYLSGTPDLLDAVFIRTLRLKSDGD